MSHALQILGRIYSECQSKRAYTKTCAKIAAKRMRRKGNARLIAYHCPFCHRWHVGHRRKTNG